MSTLLPLLGLLLVVAGITLSLVTGLDPLYSAVGAVLGALGGFLLWRQHTREVPSDNSALVSGRSFQRPLPPEEQKPSNIKNRM